MNRPIANIPEDPPDRWPDVAGALSLAYAGFAISIGLYSIIGTFQPPQPIWFFFYYLTVLAPIAFFVVGCLVACHGRWRPFWRVGVGLLASLFLFFSQMIADF